jgi:hypothetical protein
MACKVVQLFGNGARWSLRRIRIDLAKPDAVITSRRASNAGIAGWGEHERS